MTLTSLTTDFSKITGWAQFPKILFGHVLFRRHNHLLDWWYFQRQCLRLDFRREMDIFWLGTWNTRYEWWFCWYSMELCFWAVLALGVERCFGHHEQILHLWNYLHRSLNVWHVIQHVLTQFLFLKIKHVLTWANGFILLAVYFILSLDVYFWMQKQ